MQVVPTGVSSFITRCPRATGMPAPPPKLRVAAIADLMWRKRYESGVTAYVLADEWGLSPGTVENDATEAARMVEIVGESNWTKEWAQNELRLFVADNDKDRVAAMRLACELAGLVGVKGRNNEGATRTMSLEDLKVLLGPLGYEIVEKGRKE
jgi:hypothetical protein